MGFGEELIQSAHEALEIAQGKAEPEGIYIPKKVDVAEIRKRQNLSQADFADRYGLNVSTVRDWEQNRRSPDRAAMVLLSVIDREPEAVTRALSAG